MPSHVLAATEHGARYLRAYGEWLRGERSVEPRFHEYSPSPEEALADRELARRREREAKKASIDPTGPPDPDEPTGGPGR